MKSPNLATAPLPRERHGRDAPLPGRQSPPRHPGARGRAGHLPEKLSKAVGMYSVGYPFVV